MRIDELYSIVMDIKKTLTNDVQHLRKRVDKVFWILLIGMAGLISGLLYQIIAGK